MIQKILKRKRYELEVTQIESRASAILQRVKAFGVSSHYLELVWWQEWEEKEAERYWIPFSLPTCICQEVSSLFPFSLVLRSFYPQPFRDNGKLPAKKRIPALGLLLQPLAPWFIFVIVVD